jgi:serine/threonine-protein kinase HipA
MSDESPDVLSVRVGDIRVGQLTRTNEGASFLLDDDYRRLANRPVLGQVFEDDPTAKNWVRQGVPVWFSNLLPEGPLRDLIAARAGVHPSRSFFLLEVIGLDLPGAVVVAREGATAAGLVEEAEASEDVDEQPLKFSLAGVQLKFSALRDDRGLTVPAQGLGGDWIVKLPDQRFDGVPENEYSTMLWARHSGINVPEVALVEVATIGGLPTDLSQRGGTAFAVRRFDRSAGGRVHIEDFAQVLNLKPSQKYGYANYETLVRVIAALVPSDVDELLRRLVFQILAGNGDAHVKNWSLIYPDGVQARLAPAYDLMSTVPYIRNDALGLSLGRVKAFEDVTLDVFRRFADRSGIDADHVVTVVTAQVDATVEAWKTVGPEFCARDHVRDDIERRLASLPLVSA